MKFNQYKHIGMTIKEAADYLRVSTSTVKRGIKSGELPHFKIRRKPLLDKEKLDIYLKGYTSSSETNCLFDDNSDSGKPSEPCKTGNKGDQSEGIYTPKKNLKKPTGHDKNGNGGGDHGQSL